MHKLSREFDVNIIIENNDKSEILEEEIERLLKTINDKDFLIEAL